MKIKRKKWKKSDKHAQLHCFCVFCLLYLLHFFGSLYLWAGAPDRTLLYTFRFEWCYQRCTQQPTKSSCVFLSIHPPPRLAAVRQGRRTKSFGLKLSHPMVWREHHTLEATAPPASYYYDYYCCLLLYKQICHYHYHCYYHCDHYDDDHHGSGRSGKIMYSNNHDSTQWENHAKWMDGTNCLVLKSAMVNQNQGHPIPWWFQGV